MLEKIKESRRHWTKAMESRLRWLQGGQGREAVPWGEEKRLLTRYHMKFLVHD